MIKLILKHFLYDMAINTIFDNIYKNIVIGALYPIIDGNDIIIHFHNCNIIIFNISDDIVNKYGDHSELASSIANDLMFRDFSYGKSYIKEFYGLECKIEYNF